MSMLLNCYTLFFYMELSMSDVVQTVFQDPMDPVTYLFLQLHNRRFMAMEMAVLGLVQECLQGKHGAAQWLLYDFNRIYCAWLQSRKYNVEKECDDLRSLEHDNYLLAYCQGVHEMEEILIETVDYLSICRTDHQRKLVQILVKNYRHRYL